MTHMQIKHDVSQSESVLPILKPKHTNVMCWLNYYKKIWMYKMYLKKIKINKNIYLQFQTLHDSSKYAFYYVVDAASLWLLTSAILLRGILTAFTSVIVAELSAVTSSLTYVKILYIPQTSDIKCVSCECGQRRTIQEEADKSFESVSKIIQGTIPDAGTAVDCRTVKP